MKPAARFFILFVLACPWPTMSGCSDSAPPEKSTIDKLNSPDVNEQKEGLDEADKKYGGSP